ncbi:deoxyhypusine hydroxylase [Sistotremastrum niveocremeum HHB9708]|uniref:Deoxyhypusine hydroxylase n=1 Tax=Sistotremastrum niveocremeum HHB9708 TaxID=1314777 RepID=A0A164WQ57_9AGAM|nr:deoxyhypusine hydroxylase [Sistotremastrum niveocremeum HHB9708]
MSDEQLHKLENTLLNVDGTTPLHTRFRALFTLRNLANEKAVKIISKGFDDESALLKHELAYCLGQMRDESALSTLSNVLANESEDAMVRHEAAEALGAISSTTSLPILKKYCSDPERVVRETCEIALARIEWEHSPEGLQQKEYLTSSGYTSIDPAPPSAGSPMTISPAVAANSTVGDLKSTLLDRTKPLFERYRAMFALRNIGSDEAVDALAAGFSDDSALFRHEIAFVFGQLLSPRSVPPLLEVLQNNAEESMVRHEAAEALGGIATPEVLPHLKEWMSKDGAPRVVKESCAVAIDMWEYENSGEFQYANGLGPSTIAV